jgi:E3 ubiquitin-protein ligase XIAP
VTTLCTACGTTARAVVFVPCGHYIACIPCGHGMTVCPMCRSTITACVRIYE